MIKKKKIYIYIYIKVREGVRVDRRILDKEKFSLIPLLLTKSHLQYNIINEYECTFLIIHK